MGNKTKFMVGLEDLIAKNGRDNIDYVKFIQDNILHEGDALVHLIKSGSQLYGLDNENSDLDLKGLVRPSVKSLILKDDANQYGPFSTGYDSGQNTRDDVDIELWSVQKFFELLTKGDTNAIDLLYSFSYMDNVLWTSAWFEEVYESRDRLVGMEPLRKSFIGYSYGQFKKYEHKGLKFKTLELITKYFMELPTYRDNDRLEVYAYDMVPWVQERLDKTNIDIVSDAIDTYVEVNKYKKYPVGIRLKEFLRQIDRWMNRYGSRVRNEEGIDWRSLSHAYRTLYQLDYLATDGDLEFPFVGADLRFLKSIKEGNHDFRYLINRLEGFVGEMQELCIKSDKFKDKPDTKLMRKFILQIYDRRI